MYLSLSEPCGIVFRFRISEPSCHQKREKWRVSDRQWHHTSTVRQTEHECRTFLWIDVNASPAAHCNGVIRSEIRQQGCNAIDGPIFTSHAEGDFPNIGGAPCAILHFSTTHHKHFSVPRSASFGLLKKKSYGELPLDSDDSAADSSGAFSTTWKRLSCHIMLVMHLLVFGFEISWMATGIFESLANLCFLEVKGSSLFGDLTLARRNCCLKVGMPDLNRSVRRNAWIVHNKTFGSPIRYAVMIHRYFTSHLRLPPEFPDLLVLYWNILFSIIHQTIFVKVFWIWSGELWDIRATVPWSVHRDGPISWMGHFLCTPVDFHIFKMISEGCPLSGKWTVPKSSNRRNVAEQFPRIGLRAVMGLNKLRFHWWLMNCTPFKDVKDKAHV
jgi:hypothetical protein